MSAAPMPTLTPEQQSLYRTLEEQMRADGTRDELKAFIRDRLLDGAWKKDLTLHCQGVLYEKGLGGVSIEGLVESTHAKAVESVSPSAKLQMIEQIRQTLIERAEAALANEQAAQPAGS